MAGTHSTQAVALAAAELTRSLVEALRLAKVMNARSLRAMIEATTGRLVTDIPPGPEAAQFIGSLFEGDPVMRAGAATRKVAKKAAGAGRGAAASRARRVTPAENPQA